MGVESAFYVWTKCCTLTLLASEDECQSNTQDRDLESMAEVCIDIKKLQQLLAGQQVNPTKALCSKFSSSACEFQLFRDVCRTSSQQNIISSVLSVLSQLFLLYLSTSNIYIFRQ